MFYLKNKFPQFIQILISFFFLSILVFKHGYDYAPTILMVISVVYLFYFIFIRKLTWFLTKDDKKIIFIFCLYILLYFLLVAFHHGELIELYNPSKLLLLIPAILLFQYFPINFKWLLHSIPYGSLIAGITALVHRYYFHYDAAFIKQMQIQAGDMAMSLAMFSLVITLYFLSIKKYKFVFLYGIFCAFGMLASFLSTARGGWIGVPAILLIVFYSYRHVFSKKIIIGSMLFLAAAISVIAFLPKSQVMDRVTLAVSEVNRYNNQDKVTSVGARLDMWNAALLLAKDKPILGWGFEGANSKRKEYVKENIMSNYAASFTDSHNQYLDDLSKRGGLGLIGLLLIFLYPLIYFIKAFCRDDLIIKTIAGWGVVHIISVMFYCLTQSFLTHGSGSSFYFFLIIVFYSLLKQQLNTKDNSLNYKID